MIEHGYFVVDDSFRVDAADQRGFGRGYQSRDYDKYPLAGLKCARRYAKQLIPRSEWKERIAEKTAKKRWIRDLCDRVGLHVKNQSSSNYCWFHAPVRGIEVRRVLQNDRPLVLSAFCGASDIKRGRNEGGSGIVAVEYLATNGAPLESMWAPMKFSGQRTPELIDNAKRHRIVTWEDCDPRNHDELITAILTDDPVTVGIPAWRHEVLLTFLVWDNTLGRPQFGFDNSWDVDWGTNGRGILKGKMELFDEAGIVSAVSPSTT